MFAIPENFQISSRKSARVSLADPKGNKYSHEVQKFVILAYLLEAPL